MIIQALCTLVLNVLNVLFVFELPPFPETVTNVFNTAVEYLTIGISIVRFFIGSTAMGVIGVCLLLVVAANGIYFTYSVVMFILKKIPFLGIEE